MTEIFVELHVDSFQKAIDFYKLLGFELSWVGEDYLVLNKNGNVLNFYKGVGPNYQHPYFKDFSSDTKRGYGVELVIFEKDIKELYEKIKDKVKIVEELKYKRWDKWDFRIEDPFGFYLRITEPDDWKHPKYLEKSKQVISETNLKV